MLINLNSMKYIKVRKHQNNDFKKCQDFEDMGKIRCHCQNGSRHKNLTTSHSKGDVILNKFDLYLTCVGFQKL